jgi:hypothetical protein
MNGRPPGRAGPEDDTRCPACGSDRVAPRVTRRVARTDVRDRAAAERSRVWECRACQARWTERLLAHHNEAVPPEPPPEERASLPSTPPPIPKDRI